MFQYSKFKKEHYVKQRSRYDLEGKIVLIHFYYFLKFILNFKKLCYILSLARVCKFYIESCQKASHVHTIFKIISNFIYREIVVIC